MSHTTAEAESRFLKAHGIDLSPEAFQRLVHDAVNTFPRVYLANPATELSPEELRVLVREGYDLEPKPLDGRDPIALAAAEFAVLVQASLTVPAVARLLGVDPSRVRQRLKKERTLYGFRWEGDWRIPTFQFEEGRFLPHLGEVVAAIPEGLHPLAVYRWFTSPAPDLHDDHLDRDLSPREWLLIGHSPEEVVHIARYLV